MGNEGQLALPSSFGRYSLIERLAVGGMAEVFRAKIVSSHGFEKIIVIKRILPNLAADPSFVTMFIDEAKLTAQLSHPKIVQVLDFGEVNDRYFIALEYIDGFDALALLRAAAQRRVRVPIALVVFIVAEVLEALDYAHNAVDMSGTPMSLVHRDISPSNIFISRHGVVKLGDFGIAHAGDRQSQTASGTLKGKYGYMSPEQVIGAGLDARSDLFALGIVLAEAFIGRRLFTASADLEVLLMVRDARLDRLTRYGHDLPPELDRIVRKALRKDPDARYATAAAFRADLLDYLIAQRLRVGAAELRAFTSDLFDASAAAQTRVRTQGRRVSEPMSEAGAPGAPAAAPAIAASDAPAGSLAAAVPAGATAKSATPAPIVVEIDAEIPAAGGLEDAAVAAQAEAAASAAVAAAMPGGGSGDLAAGSGGIARAPGALGESGPARWPRDRPSADAEQWGAGEAPSSGKQTGWTPISQRPGAAAPAAPPSGPRGRLPTKPRATLGRFVPTAFKNPPDRTGSIDPASTSAVRVLAGVTLAGETGLLRFERPSAAATEDKPATEIKEVFFLAGAPQSVNSSVPEERFGAYLVARGVIRQAELDMALGMLPHFSGKLGDTLVGLGLMRTLDVFRQLSQQVRDRVIDLFRWSRGGFAFFSGVTDQQGGFPLGLDGFEILGAGVLTLAPGDLEARFAAEGERRPRPAPAGRESIDPDAFRLGPAPREMLARFADARPLASWLAELGDGEARTSFLRTLYLLVETDLVTLD